MYYVALEQTPGISRKVKRLSSIRFTERDEGQKFTVRTRAKLESWDALRVYQVTNGKLKPLQEHSIIF